MSSIKKNFIYLSLYNVFEMLLPIITSPLLARKLGAEALGIYTYTYSVVTCFVTVAELGLYRYGIREIAKIRDDKEELGRVYSEIFSAHLGNSLIVFIIYLLFVFFSPVSNKALFFVQGGFLIANMLDNLFFFVGIEEIRILPYRDGSVKLITFVCLLFIIQSPDDLMLYAWIMAGSSIFCRIITLLYTKKFVRFRWLVARGMKKHYKGMTVLFIPALAAVAYHSIDRIMIGQLYGNSEVAYYDCASKTLVVRNIITSLGTVLCPHIANLIGNGKRDEALRKVYQSMQISMIVSLALMGGFCAVAVDFAPLFWGKEFAVCGEFMKWLSVSIPIWCVGEVIRNQYLLPAGRDNQYVKALLSGVIVNILLNFCMIPRFGGLGAIISTIFAELIMSIMQIYMIKEELDVRKSLLELVPYLIITGIMIVTIRFVTSELAVHGIVLLAVQIMIGIVIFCLLCFLWEMFSKKKIMISMIKVIKRE